MNPKYPIYVVNRKHRTLYVLKKLNENDTLPLYLNEHGSWKNYSSDFLDGFSHRKAIQILKQHVKNLIKVRNSDYGVYGLKRDYIFVQK